MKILGSLAIAGGLLLATAGTASASTVWTLDNVTLHCPNCLPAVADNTVVGSFTVSDDLASLLAWDVNVTGTASTVDFHYTSSPANGSLFHYDPSGYLFLIGPGFNPELELQWSPALSNSVPTSVTLLAVVGGPSLDNGTFSCSSACSELNSAGTLDGTSSLGAQASVPEPATISLLGLGLVGLATRIRRRR